VAGDALGRPTAVRGCRRLLSILARAPICPCERQWPDRRVDAGCCAFGLAMRPPVRPLQERRHARPERSAHPRVKLIDMRVQESLPPGPGRLEGLQKNLKAHIAWLDRQIARWTTIWASACEARTVATQGRSDARVPGVGKVRALRCSPKP